MNRKELSSPWRLLWGIACWCGLPSAALFAQNSPTMSDSSPVEKFAVIVSVRDYPDSAELDPLTGTNRDALRLRQVLLRSGYSEENIELIYDDATRPELRPQKRNILAAVQRITGRATANDEVLVTTTSHGIVLNGMSYLCPADVTDEALYGGAPQQLLAVHEIIAHLAKSPAERKLLVVDACRDVSRSRTAGFVTSVRKPPEGLWLMSSCSEGQSSYMSNVIQEGESHAVFSYYLTEGLAGAADLLGNYDGKVSIAELQSYVYVKTQEAASRLRVSQSPELFGSKSTMYTVATVANYVPNQTIVTGDPEVERKHACALAASSAVQKINTAQQQQIERFVTSRKVGFTADRIQKDHQATFEQMCYILGNYLTPALELDPQSKLAHLGRGHIFRSSGLYSVAMEAYRQADEHFELYVMADPQALDQYLEAQEQLQSPEPSEDPATPEMTEHALRSEPNASGRRVGTVAPHAKIRIEQVVKDQALQEEWLFVSAVDDVELVPGGWIAREHVVWFKEAADLYTPKSPMQSGENVRLASTLSRMDSVSTRMNSIADRMSEPAQRIHAAGDAINNSGYGRARAIAGRFGVGLPNIGGYLHQAGGYAEIPANHARRAAGIAQLPGNYTRSYTSGYVGAYRAGLERSSVTVEQQEKLLAAATLAPVQDKRLTFSHLPWSNQK